MASTGPSLVASRPQVAEAVAGSRVAIRGGKAKLLPKCSQSAQAPSILLMSLMIHIVLKIPLRM
jgi:hypothetical protein